MGMIFRSLLRMALTGIAVTLVRRFLRFGRPRRVDTIADLPNNS
jgi:hypothetical protein